MIRYFDNSVVLAMLEGDTAKAEQLLKEQENQILKGDTMSHLRLVETPEEERPPMLEGHWEPPMPKLGVQIVRFFDRCVRVTNAAKVAWREIKKEEWMLDARRGRK